MSQRVPAALRLFRLLLRLLPFELRFDYGGDMEQVFRDQHRDALRAGGRAGVARLSLRALHDIALTAPREHLADARRDAAYALRGLRRNPGFTLVALLTLALGIGANTAIFSVVDGVLLRPAPLPGLDRLVMVWETDRATGTSREPASVPDYLDFASRSRRLDRLGAFMATEVNFIRPGAEPLRLATLRVSHTLLPMLALEPMVGRGFTDAEDQPGGPKVAIISQALWERSFNRDPAVVGRTMRIDDVPTTIVGVLPARADFGIPQVLASGAYSRSFTDRSARVTVDVWTPLQPDVKALPRETHPLFVIGRLAPDRRVAAAQDELSSIASLLERAYPVNAGRGVYLESLGEVVFGRVRPALLMLMGAVSLVLLVACVNIANLLLARGMARSQEIAIRRALGAGSWRLGRQFLIENLVLTITAAAAGVALAALGVKFLSAMAPSDVPRVSSIAIDLRVLTVTLAISVLAGLVFGIVPTLQARRVDVQAGLVGAGRHSAGRGVVRLRGLLVGAEVGLAVVLVVGATLLTRSLWRVEQVDPGFRAAGVLKAEFQLPAARYPAQFRDWPNFREIHAFNDAILRRAASLPGVEAAAIAGNHPLDPGFTNSFAVVGREEESRSWPEISIRRVTPGYFTTVGLSLVHGRLFTDSDSTGAAPVVVINVAAAKRFFPRGNPEGAQIRFWGAARTVVGIVADERFQGLTAAAPIALYAPLAQAPSTNGAGVLLVRTPGDPLPLAPSIRKLIHERDPELAVFGVEPLQRTMSRSVSERVFTLRLLLLLAGVALLLAAVGVHGVLSYGVSQRTREIGIRLALGARPEGVRRAVVREGLVMAIAGLAVGLTGAYALARVFRSLLFEVTPGDPLTYAAVAACLAAVAVAASYLPARRATRIDPVLALRAE